MKKTLEYLRKSYNFIAAAVLATILGLLIAEELEWEVIAVIMLILILFAVQLRQQVEEKKPLTFGQFITFAIIVLIVLFGIRYGVYFTTEKMAVEATKQANLITTLNAELAKLHVQDDVIMRTHPGNLNSDNGMLEKCEIVDYLAEIPIGKELWIHVFSYNLRTDGWITNDLVSRSSATCPTPTGTSTITPTLTGTPTPTETSLPSSTPEPTNTLTSKQDILLVINDYYSNISEGNFNGAWDFLHQDYKDNLGKPNWEKSLSKKEFVVEIFMRNIKESGNKAAASGTIYITPEFQETQKMALNLCIIRKNSNSKWLILYIIEDETDKSCI